MKEFITSYILTFLALFLLMKTLQILATLIRGAFLRLPTLRMEELWEEENTPTIEKLDVRENQMDVIYVWPLSSALMLPLFYFGSKELKSCA